MLVEEFMRLEGKINKKSESLSQSCVEMPDENPGLVEYTRVKLLHINH
jgi:hypothetical protein